MLGIESRSLQEPAVLVTSESLLWSLTFVLKLKILGQSLVKCLFLYMSCKVTLLSNFSNNRNRLTDGRTDTHPTVLQNKPRELYCVLLTKEKVG